jgi:hypothetical protein
MGSGVGGALWPIEPPVNPIAGSAHGNGLTGKSAAPGVDGSPGAGAVTDFTAVANTRGSYPSRGMTDYQGNNVAYTTSFNAATGYWEQSTGDGFLINAISWAPRDAAPSTPRSAMSLSMTLQSESLYSAGRSFLGDAYRVAVHEALNPDNTWATRTGYGLSALVVALPGFLNDLSRDLYNSPNDLYAGGKKMSAGLTNRDPYGFSDGLMRFSTGLLSAAGGAAIAEKGIVSNRLAKSNETGRATYVERENGAKVELSPARSDTNMANQSGTQGGGQAASELGAEGKFKESAPEVLAGANTISDSEINPALASRLDLYKAWKAENGVVGTPSVKEFQLFDNPNRVQTGFRTYANKEWPPNFGALDENSPFTLLPGAQIDRFGSDFGSYLSPTGTSYTERALRPGTQNAPYSVFEVTFRLDVEAATIRPWFGEMGIGTQFKLLGDTRVKDLLEAGQLKEIYRGPYNGYQQ